MRDGLSRTPMPVTKSLTSLSESAALHEAHGPYTGYFCLASVYLFNCGQRPPHFQPLSLVLG